MKELIKIETNDRQEPFVSGRTLHEFLKVTTPYTQWFDRMKEYGFDESIDFTPVSQKCASGGASGFKVIQDHIIKLDMAKELCMIQRTDKGKQARQYFIAVEKEYNSPEKLMARALLVADETINNLNRQIETDKPKVQFANSVETSNQSILVGQLAKLIKQSGHNIGQNRLFEWMRNNGYLIKRGHNYNQPTQKSMELGLMEVKERTINNPDGSVRITMTPKVTGKGQIYFVDKFIGKTA